MMTVAMRWWIRDIEPAARAALGRVGSSGSVDSDLFYLQSLHRPGMLGKLLVLAVVCDAVLALLLYTLPPPTSLASRLVYWVVVATAGTWTVLLATELVRGARSDVKPFLLVTPTVILRCDYGHGLLSGHRLKDATRFDAVEQYGQDQRYRGRQYTTTFPDEVVTFGIVEARAIERLEEVVAAARAGAAGGGSGAVDLLPAAPPATGAGWRELTNPTSRAWVIGGGLLCVLAFAFTVLTSR